VLSGSLVPTLWKQLLSKLSNSLSDYTTCIRTVSFIASAVKTKNATSVCVCTQSLACFLTDLGKYSRLGTVHLLEI
jgi:hypothetical protein